MMLLPLALLPLEIPVTETCDAIEVNSVFDDHGRQVFRQAIVRDVNRYTGKSDIRCWWIIRNQLDEPAVGEVLRFDGPTMRRIQAGRVYRTHYQFDVEVYERKQLPVELRRGMRTFLEED